MKLYDTELEANKVEIPSSILELGKNIGLLEGEKEVCYIDSELNTEFYGYCDGILDPNEIEIIRMTLSHQVITSEEALSPLDISAKIVTDEKELCNSLVLNCGSSKKWNLQLQITAGESDPMVYLQRGKKISKVNFNSRTKLLFSTIAGVMNKGIPQVQFCRYRGIGRQKWG